MIVRGPVEACSDAEGMVVEDRMHPLLGAACLAWWGHRPLVISPDMVWLAIIQGVAKHISLNAETHRSKFVEHDGRRKIFVRMDGFKRGDPGNPWPTLFTRISRLIREHLRFDAYQMLVQDFSTTGAIERAAMEVGFLESMEQYFWIQGSWVCGIPWIGLEGTPNDWAKLSLAVGRIHDLGLEWGLEWWTRALRKITIQFERASRGDVDPGFWKSIVSRGGECEPPSTGGWIADLFPYIWGHRGGYVANTNLGIRKDHAVIMDDYFPNGLSRCPLHCDGCQGKAEYEFLAGFTGVVQDKDTMALRPKIGWAVREIKPCRSK